MEDKGAEIALERDRLAGKGKKSVGNDGRDGEDGSIEVKKGFLVTAQSRASSGFGRANKFTSSFTGGNKKSEEN